jgi:hypothetical protein
MTWKDEFRTLPAPEPSSELLPRILASRAAGVRVALPGVRRVWSYRFARYAAAVVLVGGVATFSAIRMRLSDERAAKTAWEAGVPLMPSELFAQEPGGRMVKGSYPAVRDLEPSSLAPAKWVYREKVMIDGIVTDTATTDTVRIEPTIFDARPALLMASTWASRAYVGLDTLIISRVDLRPLRRWCCGHRTSREFRFADRDVGPLFLARPAPGYAGTRMNPDMSLTIGFANFLQLKPVLQALPLRDRWQGSLYLSPLGPYDPLPVDVRVVGHDRQTVPAGTFECWRVQLTLPANRRALTVWISRGKQSVVRVRQEVSDGAIEEVLVAHQPTPPTP